MKNLLFPRLAWQGIRKNRRVYVPYMLACIGMVMMAFILQSLSYTPLLQQMKGGRTVEIVLTLGKIVVAVFALIFLVYTNSFLIRHRNREFGLYNVLGMGKKGLCKIIFWESLMVAVIGLGGGIGLGIAFSKLAELGLVRVLHGEADYVLRLDGESIVFTLEVYGVIFAVLFAKSLITVWRMNPLDLMLSNRRGEKPVKANWLLALLGVVTLGVAYYMAVTIQSPLRAMTMFFVAVILVIFATYMLFTAGSVTLCRVLQKNKKYYYQKNHFVSVSTMAYRMKRNGAGLASICILSTMVLVMLTSTSSLYFGTESSLKSQYPQDSYYSVSMKKLDNLQEEPVKQMEDAFHKMFDRYGVTPKNVSTFTYAYTIGLDTGNGVEPGRDNLGSAMSNYDNLREIYFISQDSYNAWSGEQLHLQPGEALVKTLRCDYKKDTFSMCGTELNVVGQIDRYPAIGSAMSSVYPSMMFVISDYDLLRPMEQQMEQLDREFNVVMNSHWYYGYDLDTDPDTAIEIHKEMRNAIMDVACLKNGNGYSWSSGCLFESRDEYYSTYGGLFFLGIILSVVFVFAAIMIIYYKQLSEGYEDQGRFVIMQKVGMTHQDIRKTINSQVLTVFFAPLLMGGMHLAFAFPLVWKLLQLFMLSDRTLAILVNIGGFLVFGVLYAIVYRITSHVYYSIVSGEPARS